MLTPPLRLNYHNLHAVQRIPGLREVNVGHSIVSRGIYVGLRQAVREFKVLLAGGAL